MGLQPLGDRVIVEEAAERERIEGGIVLPETASERPTQGTVLAIGPGARKDDGTRIEMPVKVGDKVIYGKYSGTEIEVEGKEVKILGVDEILAVAE